MDNDNKIVEELLKNNNVLSFEKMLKQKRASGERSGTTIGNGNIIAGGSISINQPPAIQQIMVTPGEQHITDAQAYEIKELVRQIVVLEAHVKEKPRGYAAVWASFKRKFKCTKYQLLTQEQFDPAISYLRQTIGRLSRSVKAKQSPEWRKRKYSFIHTNVKKLGIEQERKDYMAINFGAESMKELSDRELEQLYNWVAKLK
ncbi:putative DNA-binding protein [Catenovulum agarivorans DS-2]|uniref:Putative DNA-binding protein n=1 Tax=Catenovulum agarivorans DS-2 TaxID=1328313 RepID=W7QPN0_9ALTE|nr:ORF6C domain-containing protein [Catenovulum agarivorans]EWH09843.1 putative DNA-binding protein [Catenovulum agarivorans DS-2]